MRDFRYGFEETLEGVGYDEAIERITQGLKAEGFGVLTEIDVKRTLKKKLDFDFRRYVILGACNPNLAKQALLGDDELGLLLPCNVVVQERDDGKIAVSIADPRAMFTLVDNPSVAPIAEEAEARLRRALATLKG